MASAINMTKENSAQNKVIEEIKKRFDTPDREPGKALDGMFGLWQNESVSLEDIRQKKRRKKW